ncbi:hypothetical protein MRX96_002759 [Rhipicephalus microplus]
MLFSGIVNMKEKRTCGAAVNVRKFQFRYRVQREYKRRTGRKSRKARLSTWPTQWPRRRHANDRQREHNAQAGAVIAGRDVGRLGHTTVDFARRLDREDPLKKFRKRFVIPKLVDLTGVDAEFIKCLGSGMHLHGRSPVRRQAKRALDDEVQKVLDDWGKKVSGDNVAWVHSACGRGYLPTSTADLYPKQRMAELVGADRDEIVFMNGLTVNLHLLMMTYYRPEGMRTKYAAQSQVSHHGLDVASNLILLSSREGEELLREEDIYDVIDKEGDTIAILLLCGVQYQTGQALDIRGITSAARKKGCIVLWDLAHAVCNVELRLNEWEIDLAAWCTYKYMNCGPGCTAVAYVSHKFRKSRDRLPELRGWWGNEAKTRLLMRREFEPSPSADMFKGLRRQRGPDLGDCDKPTDIQRDTTHPFHLLTPADVRRRGEASSACAWPHLTTPDKCFKNSCDEASSETFYRHRCSDSHRSLCTTPTKMRTTVYKRSRRYAIRLTTECTPCTNGH